MKLLWSVCFLLVLIPRSGAQELTGLRQVKIIDDFPKGMDTVAGLSHADVESQTLVALKRDIPRLDVNKTAHSFAYVNIMVLESRAGLQVVCISLEVKRPVNILANDMTTVVSGGLATTWDDGAILLGGADDMASRIRTKISELVTNFAAAYYRDNPH